MTLERQIVALDEFGISRQHHVADAAPAVEARLAQAADRNAYLPAFQHVLDVALLGRLADRLPYQRLGGPQQTLRVLEAFSSRIEPTVDEMHGALPEGVSRPASPACTIRLPADPGGLPRAPSPLARQTRK